MTLYDLEKLEDEALQTTRRIIARTYAILHNPERHTAGTEARNARGNRVKVTSKNAVQFCLIGAETRAEADLKLGDRWSSVFRWYESPTALLDQCAIELYPAANDNLCDKRNLRPAARANDDFGHQAALKVLRCSMQKVRAELKRRRGQS